MSIAKLAGRVLLKLDEPRLLLTPSMLSVAGSPMLEFLVSSPLMVALSFPPADLLIFVSHLSSSPHYPQSNGHAEAAVKAMKTLILKTTSNGDLNVDSFQRVLLEWRNTPRANGESPAQALFHRPLTSFVLAHHSTFAPEHQQHSDLLDSRTAARSDGSTARYDGSAQPLPVLCIGLRVDLPDPRSKLWSTSGTIVALGRNRDYLVKVPSG